jgi:hypothetical protein
VVAAGPGISALSKFFARYTPECSRLISKLPPETKRLVRSTIDALLAKPEMGTELTGELDGYRSYRVRRYTRFEKSSGRVFADLTRIANERSFISARSMKFARRLRIATKERTKTRGPTPTTLSRLS